MGFELPRLPYAYDALANTIDAQTIEDQTVTIRDRDTMQQERVSTDSLRGWLDERVV